MGTWGKKLYSNDIACDVRDSYINLLKKQYSSQDAYEQVKREYKEVFGKDEEPIFWFALADTQWKTGRLTEDVKEKAFMYLEALKDNRFADLRGKLNQPMPPKKKFSKQQDFVKNPWEVGDIYAYQLHGEDAAKYECEGKYMLLQKVGNRNWYGYGKFSLLQMYDKIFEEIPKKEVIKNLTILPMALAPGDGDTPDRIEDYLPSFTFYTKTIRIIYKKNDYPAKHLTFIGNMPVEEDTTGNYDDLLWEKNDDGMYLDYYFSWKRWREKK